MLLWYVKTREIEGEIQIFKKTTRENQILKCFLRYGPEVKDEKWLKKIQRCIIQKFPNVWVPNGKF